MAKAIAPKEMPDLPEGMIEWARSTRRPGGMFHAHVIGQTACGSITLDRFSEAANGLADMQYWGVCPRCFRKSQAGGGCIMAATFHETYGVPGHFPGPVELTDEQRALCAGQSWRLIKIARDDFLARFPVLGHFDTLSGRKQMQAWAAHCEAYIAAAFDQMFEQRRAAA